MLFSHESCDVCATHGIKYEAVSYKDSFDYNEFRYYSHTYKAYVKLNDVEKDQMISIWAQPLPSPNYRIYYLCSQECSTMLQFQLGG